MLDEIDLSPDKYLILEGRTHGHYSYPDVLVSMNPIYIANGWYGAQMTLNQKKAFMSTIRQFVDFLLLLKSGNACDGKGMKVPKSKLDQILDEIATVRNPWRAEWLDAKFTKKLDIQKNEQLQISYHLINSDHTISVITEPLEEQLDISCGLEDNDYLLLAKERIDDYFIDYAVYMDLDSWLQNATSQGLPNRYVTNGDLLYMPPRFPKFIAGYLPDPAECLSDRWGNRPTDHFVASFLACNEEVGLDCSNNLEKTCIRPAYIK